MKMTPSVLNILQINSSGRKQGSVSRQLATRVTDNLLATNPQASLVRRDLAAGLPLVDDAWIGANFTPKEDRTPAQNQTLGLSDTLVAELRAADVIVIGLPIYNFGMPAAMKLWVDLVARVGETFHYTDTGPVGLLTSKRAILTVASGGIETGSAADYASTHLKFVLGFLGITDVTTVSANGPGDTVVPAAEQAIDALALAA
jgi:FMN-dependent NADH-azoreductase